MKRKYRFLALIALVLLVLSGCSSNDVGSSDVKWDLSLAVNGTDTQIDSQVTNHFAELVKEKSVKIKYILPFLKIKSSIFEN